MKTKNALEIIKKRIGKNPVLKQAYVEEEKKYHIACKIREYRKAAGLTQKMLAQMIETKQSVISRMESADYQSHSISLLKKIASALNIRIEDLMRDENEVQTTFTLHVPQIMRKAASFKNWEPNQILAKRPYAR